MDLFEYQARDLFAAHGVPVLDAVVATTPQEAREGAERLGGGTVVVKAQVKTGGRGKAGGVKLAHSPDEAAAKAAEILGMDIKGHIVQRVMVAQGAKIAEEYYLSILLDRANRTYLAMCSREGGMDIETLAVERPEALARVPVDAIIGVDDAKAAEIVQKAGYTGDLAGKVAEVLKTVWEVFDAEDATLVEINPLVLTEDGTLLAIDGKVSLDANADIRHPDHEQYHDHGAADPFEARAKEKGLNYVKLDGEVGVVGNGAGLVMSTLDVVAYAGEEYGVKPANFLDLGGGSSAQVMADGLELILSDPQVKSVFVNVFGGITSCDTVANGIVQAFDLLASHGAEVTHPLVLRLDGNNAEVARQILDEANLPNVERLDTMDGAAHRAAELASIEINKGA